MDLRSAYPIEEVEDSLPREFTATSNISSEITESLIHRPHNLSLEEANKHLRYGYFDRFEVKDARLLTGEGVILCHIVNNRVIDILRVHSTAFNWRLTLRGDDPNIYHRFCLLQNTVQKYNNTQDDYQRFCKNFIAFEPYDVNEIRTELSQGPIVVLDPGSHEASQLFNRETRLHVMWLNFFLTLPASHQIEALDYLHRLEQDRIALASYLIEVERSHVKQDPSKINLPHNRMAVILSMAREESKKKLHDPLLTRKGQLPHMNDLIKSNIHNLVRKEDGGSFYAMTMALRSLKEGKLHPKPPRTKKAEKRFIDTSRVNF